MDLEERKQSLMMDIEMMTRLIEIGFPEEPQKVTALAVLKLKMSELVDLIGG